MKHLPGDHEAGGRGVKLEAGMQEGGGQGLCHLLSPPPPMSSPGLPQTPTDAPRQGLASLRAQSPASRAVRSPSLPQSPPITWHMCTHTDTWTHVRTCRDTYARAYRHAHVHGPVYTHAHTCTRAGLAPSFKLGSSLVSTSPQWGTSPRCKCRSQSRLEPGGLLLGSLDRVLTAGGQRRQILPARPGPTGGGVDPAAHASHHRMAMWGLVLGAPEPVPQRPRAPAAGRRRNLLQPASRWARGPPGGVRHPF